MIGRILLVQQATMNRQRSLTSVFARYHAHNGPFPPYQQGTQLEGMELSALPYATAASTTTQ